MIGVKALLVILTFSDDIRLFMATKEGIFISSFGIGVLWRANIQSLKSIVADSLTFPWIFNVPVLKLSGILPLANLWKGKTFWQSKSNLKDRLLSRLLLTLLCKLLSVSFELSEFWNTISIVSWLEPFPVKVFSLWSKLSTAPCMIEDEVIVCGRGTLLSMQ